LDLSLGNYTLIDDFYVIDLADTNVVLGVQWIYSLGKFFSEIIGNGDGLQGSIW
jgi:hypothetical protein